MADRHIEISLVKRGVTATAQLLDERAPITCAAVWDALPLAGDVYHAKYARNESTPFSRRSRRRSRHWKTRR
jgi:hypothetical protein